MYIYDIYIYVYQYMYILSIAYMHIDISYCACHSYTSWLPIRLSCSNFQTFAVLTKVAPSQDGQVKALPDIELDGETLVDDDSDMEETAQEKKEHAIEAQKSRIHCTFRASQCLWWVGSGESSQKHSSFLVWDGLGIIWVGFGGLIRAQHWGFLTVLRRDVCWDAGGFQQQPSVFGRCPRPWKPPKSRNPKEPWHLRLSHWQWNLGYLGSAFCIFLLFSKLPGWMLNVISLFLESFGKNLQKHVLEVHS